MSMKLYAQINNENKILPLSEFDSDNLSKVSKNLLLIKLMGQKKFVNGNQIPEIHL